MRGAEKLPTTRNYLADLWGTNKVFNSQWSASAYLRTTRPNLPSKGPRPSRGVLGHLRLQRGAEKRAQVADERREANGLAPAGSREVSRSTGSFGGLKGRVAS